MVIKGVIYTIISALLFGFTPIISSMTFEMGNNATSLTFYRNLFVLPVMLLILAKQRQSMKLTKKELFQMLPIGILGITLTTLTLYMSYKYIQVGVATTLHFMYPVFVAFFCRIFFKDKLGIVKIIVLAMASIGVVFFFEGGFSGQLTGIILALGSGITYAYYLIAVEKVGLKDMHPIKLSAYFAAIAAITMLIYNLFTNEIVWNLSAKTYGLIFIVAMGTSFLGVVLLQMGIRYLGASSAAIFCMFEPLGSVFFGWLILGEKLSLKKIIGSLLILAAVSAMILYDKYKAKKDALQEIGGIMEKDIVQQNKESWDAIADSFFGVTALPTYGCFIPTEDELNLFPMLKNKIVLDIGCGSGHSLKWCGDKGAAELWGIDLSTKQIENATAFLTDNNYKPNLFNAPMERNPGIPQNYFDIVYSIYAIGWTVDIQATFNLISSYLKKDGVFIFSWDHPFMHCVEATNEKLIFSGSYYEKEPFTFKKDVNKPANRNNPDLEKESGFPMTLYNRRLSDYINALSKAGFAVEKVVEETDKETLNSEYEFSPRYYSPCKAKKFPQSIVFKSRKL